jgi:hypothetical protein
MNIYEGINPPDPRLFWRVLAHETVLEACERLRQERADIAKFAGCGEERQTFAERHADWAQWNRIN